MRTGNDDRCRRSYDALVTAVDRVIDGACIGKE